MHIYHYAAYEVSAIRRLSTGHATREEEVDHLLRNEVFVDLYQIVRHGILLGEDSYSIKKVELLYRGKRRGDVATAGRFDCGIRKLDRKWRGGRSRLLFYP